MQARRAGVAGEFAQEVLIARSLAVMGILVVEACTGQRDVLGVGMNRLASHFRAEGGDQSARPQHVRKGVIAGIVQLEANLAANINPDRNPSFLTSRGIALRHTLYP